MVDIVLVSIILLAVVMYTAYKCYGLFFSKEKVSSCCSSSKSGCGSGCGKGD